MCILARCLWMEKGGSRPSPPPTCEYIWSSMCVSHINVSAMPSCQNLFSFLSHSLFFVPFLISRSSSFPFSDSPLYSQTPSASSSAYFEATHSSESDISNSLTPQPVSVATTAASSGAAAAGGGYAIHGGYVLGGGQSYSSPNSRAPPATVSVHFQQ